MIKLVYGKEKCRLKTSSALFRLVNQYLKENFIDIKIIHIDFNKLELNKKEKFTREDIFNMNNNISTLFRKSLYPEHPYPNLPLILNKDVAVFVLFIPVTARPIAAASSL